MTEDTLADQQPPEKTSSSDKPAGFVVLSIASGDSGLSSCKKIDWSVFDSGSAHEVRAQDVSCSYEYAVSGCRVCKIVGPGEAHAYKVVLGRGTAHRSMIPKPCCKLYARPCHILKVLCTALPAGFDMSNYFAPGQADRCMLVAAC